MDTVSRERRSWIMSRIRSRDTKPELALRGALWSRGLRYRIYYDKLPGRPDIVFLKKKVAVFMDGCFWHGCSKCYRLPKSNSVFWRGKVSTNKERDKKQNEELRQLGWTVLRFWEHDVNRDLDCCIRRIVREVNDNEVY